MEEMILSLSEGATLQGGKFKIIKVLGQGGFGITYLAEHTVLGARVAIKEFFPQDYCNRDGSTSHISVATVSNRDLVNKLRARFVSEARNIAKIHHPGIIRIQDIFEENGTAYYVMDFIDGQSLADFVKENGAIPEKDALSLIDKIATALGHIHQAQMTHFDIKPANIMLRKEDGEPVIIDFGLSKQYNDSGHAYSTLLMGLSHGFSPIEQYFQDGLDGFSPATDIYALGATLYYMVAGRVPPEAPKLAGADIQLPVNIAANTAGAVQWAMKTDKGARPQSVDEWLLLLRSSDSRTMLANGSSSSADSSQTADVSKTTLGGPSPVSPGTAQNFERPEKKGNNPAVVAFLIIAAIIAIACLVYFVGRDNSSSRAVVSEMTAAVIDDEGKEETIVAEVEEPAAAEEAPANEEEYRNSPEGYWEMEGEIAGQYPIVFYANFKEDGDVYRVTGKYAYTRILKSNGDKPTSWFNFSGWCNADGSNFNVQESTPYNPEYDATLTAFFDFRNGTLDGWTESNYTDDPPHRFNVRRKSK